MAFSISGLSLDQFETLLKNEDENKSQDKSKNLSKSIFSALLGGNATKKQSTFLDNFINNPDTNKKLAFLATADKDDDGTLTSKEFRKGIRKYNSAERKNKKALKKADQAEALSKKAANTNDPIEKQKLEAAADRKTRAMNRKLDKANSKYFDEAKENERLIIQEQNKEALNQIANSVKVDVPGLKVEKAEVKEKPRSFFNAEGFVGKKSDDKHGNLTKDGAYTVKKDDTLYNIVKEQVKNSNPDASKKEILETMYDVYQKNKAQGLIGDINSLKPGYKLDLSSITNKTDDKLVGPVEKQESNITSWWNSWDDVSKKLKEQSANSN